MDPYSITIDRELIGQCPKLTTRLLWILIPYYKPIYPPNSLRIS